MRVTGLLKSHSCVLEAVLLRDQVAKGCRYHAAHQVATKCTTGICRLPAYVCTAVALSADISMGLPLTLRDQ